MAYVSIKITRDDISPTLSKMAAAAQNPQKVFLAMGNTFKSITEGNFNSGGAVMRPKPWPAKKDGTPATLKKSGTLSSSFHLAVSPTGATLSNPTIYSARHQFGDDRGKPMPARPFFPVDNGKLTPAAERLIQRAGERAVLRQAGQSA